MPCGRGGVREHPGEPTRTGGTAPARHPPPEVVQVSVGRDDAVRPPWTPRNRRRAARAGASTRSAAAYEADARSLRPTVPDETSRLNIARRFGSAMISKTDSTLLIYVTGHMPVKAYTSGPFQATAVLRNSSNQASPSWYWDDNLDTNGPIPRRPGRRFRATAGARRRTISTPPSAAPPRSREGSSRIRSKASRSCSAAAAPSSPTTWASARRARRSSRCGTPRPTDRTSSSAPRR